MAAQRRRAVFDDDDLRARLVEALGRLRNVARAAAELGVCKSTIWRARYRYPEVDMAWQAALAEFPARVAPLALAGPRVIRWTTDRRRAFLAALGQSGSPKRAARAAGGSIAAAYALRDRDAEFCTAWTAARTRAYDLLEGETLDRAINGVERTVVVGGDTRVIKHYDLGLAMKLLVARWARGEAAPRGRIIELTRESVAAARESVVTRLIEHGVAGIGA